MTISRFFVPRNSNSKSTSSKKPKVSPIFVGEDDDGWEKPIGLTKKYAITIEDTDNSSTSSSSGQAQDPTKDEIHAYSNSKKESETAHKHAIDESQDDNEKIEILSKTSSAATKQHIDVHRTEEAESVSSPSKVEEKRNTKTTIQNRVEGPVEGTVEGTETETGAETISGNKATATENLNPFLQFAYDLGGCESSYFASLSTSIPSN